MLVFIFIWFSSSLSHPYRFTFQLQVRIRSVIPQWEAPLAAGGLEIVVGGLAGSGTVCSMLEGKAFLKLVTRAHVFLHVVNTIVQ
ncbi:MAG: hypothetical protein GWO20_20175 [Candidatus Korarchaeota archaeon]|nr:hypothetical protein [Candidatus Korarchaeota archaeon]NIU85551.1 hypothetical protein [Candidatus Thorarchaeota archaeon]NIW15662.1 hypothetical protein [Candidatus Thorarchaeota archaeon]NIW53592.1 hypothetical protein [Candidatus Korarchaeota archaeon]